jgi:hypothetical protein
MKAKEIDLTAGTDRPRGSAEGETPGQVREVALPPNARTLTTLSRVDYTHAFRLETGQAQDRTGEEWARALLEDAPAATRMTLRRGWFALGVRLGSTEDERLVLGWPVRRSSPDFALLAASSLIGVEAEVLCKRDQHALLVATFIQVKNPVARAVWAGVSPRHRKVLRHLIKEASRRAGDKRGAPWLCCSGERASREAYDGYPHEGWTSRRD